MSRIKRFTDAAKTLADVKDAYGGRRFILTVMSGTVASLLQWFGKLDPLGSTYATIIIATVAAYITGNIAERKIDATNNKFLPGGDGSQPGG